MKAAFCEKFGSHTDLVVREIEPPGPPEPGQVQVDIKVRGIQFSDLVRIGGNYQDKTVPPFIVGGDGAGVVVKVGEGVTSLKPGDRVLTSTGCVEQVNLKADRLTLLPPNADLDAASAFRNGYATGYHGLNLARLQPGETLLVHGAAGGMGLAAVDLGKLFGARVIATASSDEKLEVVKACGADHTINYTNGFRDQVKELTGGKGADVIYDPVGGDVFDESMRCIAPFGRILVVGFTSGRPALAKTNHLLVKDAQVIGYTMGGLMRHDPQKERANFRTLLDWLAHGRIKPHISHRKSMDEIVEAYQLLVDRLVIGKVMIV
ncbi:MAG: NADPH:quinone oxidoreductase family protein [Proteobacteria bacterium]|nr:NADPH:quinone oxidoreductase family protein [Pseudomonadota bacterium]